MDSVGATARTPHLTRSPGLNGHRHSRHSGMLHEPAEPTSASYGAIPLQQLRPVARSASNPRDTSSFLPTTAATRGLNAITRTPKHSYHSQKPLLNGLLGGKKDLESLPIVDGVADGKQQQASPETGRAVKIGLYGVLNTVICIPVMISFAQIIFRDPAFQPYMSDLVKLVLTSAAIHQTCFTLSSSLPFAIGQVQDAGLIFLSAMASSIVQALRKKEHELFSMEEVIATTLFTLAISTALLGVALIITGKLKIASFVQYLPMPVVGGYLAYIGFYCLEAGLSMMANKTIKDPADWVQLANADALLLVTPGIITGILVFFVLSRYEHVAILPCCMFAILLVFYLILLVTGTSLEEARAAGWVSPPPATPRSIVEIYSFYDWQLADLSYLVPQLPTWIAMYFVVAFSSSLDVAAIEMSLGTPLDHNHELQTVGLSNLVSGLTGGFTGSYIFSQTIFTMRAKLDSRANGMLIVLLEIAVVLCPFSVIAYVPKMFFGALQTLIAIDLMTEWMWHARHKMLTREYAIVWFTFIIMNAFNLEVGIVLGIVIAAFNFIWSYIMAVASVHRVMKRSRVERDLRESALLEHQRLSIVTLELDGFIFFGSSVKMMEEVRKHVLVNVSEAQQQQQQEQSQQQQNAFHSSPSLPTRNGSSSLRSSMIQAQGSSSSTLPSESENEQEGLMTLERGVDGSMMFATNNIPTEFAPLSMHAVRTRFCILDFERVRGVDATAMRSCFHAIKQLLDQHGIVLVFSNVPPQTEKLLRVNEVIETEDEDGSLLFETLDKALEWCEDEILVAQGLFPLSETSPREHDDGKQCRIELLHKLLPAHPDKALKHDDSVVLTKEIGDLYIEPVIKGMGEYVYRAGHAVTGMFFVGYGKVDVYLPSNLHEGMGPGFSGRKRILRVCQGGIIGASEFILHKRHEFTAEARATTFLFYLSKTKYRKMQQDHPQIAARFQQAMLQSLARTVMESNIADD
ncbi:hypothetical protein Poli38472_007468 [Pythium oligandrum]|uniref:Sulfate transporter n=1 Tax=Pythium oligandrum TaxID=41045 RepID=A0A8K1CSE4_PYTOL|nr:hypothetical protein Poli38472_007468 [Pythium oligandrum]|eukprot:TMW67796.1 hypothetical protein Poli38472_007468 [Pythium oligandrum]